MDVGVGLGVAAKENTRRLRLRRRKTLLISVRSGALPTREPRAPPRAIAQSYL